MKKEIETLVQIDCKKEAETMATLFEEFERDGQDKIVTAFLNGYKLGQLNQRKEGQPA